MLKKLTKPDDSTAKAVTTLALSCCRHDNQILSYPLEDADCHYLFYADDGTLISALAMTGFGDAVTECSAFTLPGHRRQGYFSYLLNAALEDYEETDILFACDPGCADTQAVLKHLGAQPDSCEYQMEYTIDTATTPIPPVDQELDLQLLPQPDGSCLRQLICRGQIAGSCLTTPISDECICLHQVQIQDQLRGQGLGQDLLRLFFLQLSDSPIHTVILQVSGDNQAAIALYKKTGFRVTRTLSYYCY
ncbi:MAG: GNAT family N-acetyltransferase [Lachnospiraceae bacterium]